MIRIALLEDEKDAEQLFRKNLDKYAREYGVEFHIAHFDNAVSFLADYKPVYDIVFMDIRMPDMDGIEASHKLREMDKSVILIFLTNLSQYAIKGYEVDALDFIVKPISYCVLVLKLRRALNCLARTADDIEVPLKVDTSIFRVRASKIKYVEVIRHKLVFHTTDGDFTTYGALKNVEDELSDADFARCNICYLVNLRYVSYVKGQVVEVGGEPLRISHPKRKSFVGALNEYLGRGGGVVINDLSVLALLVPPRLSRRACRCGVAVPLPPQAA